MLLMGSFRQALAVDEVTRHFMAVVGDSVQGLIETRMTYLMSCWPTRIGRVAVTPARDRLVAHVTELALMRIS